MTYQAVLQEKVAMRRKIGGRVEVQLIRLGIVDGQLMPKTSAAIRRQIVNAMVPIVMAERAKAVLDYRKNLIGGDNGQ